MLPYIFRPTVRWQFLPRYDAVASRAAIITISGSDGRVDGIPTKTFLVQAKWPRSSVITTVAIRPFDDRTYCARSAFTHLELLRKLHDWLFAAPLHNLPICSQMCSTDIIIFVDLQPFSYNLKDERVIGFRQVPSPPARRFGSWGREDWDTPIG